MDCAPSPKAPVTVLVVDDNENVRRIVCRILTSLGLNVVEASTANEALQLATSYAGAIDVLVSDLFLGSMTGVELATQWIRLRAGTAVLLMSGSSERLLQKAGWQFIQKPFCAEELQAKIEELLSTSQDNPVPTNKRDKKKSR
jgi:DNA-binding NtrC family response regulator